MRQKPLILWREIHKKCYRCKKECDWLVKLEKPEEVKYWYEYSVREYKKHFCFECEVEKWWKELKDSGIIEE